MCVCGKKEEGVLDLEYFCVGVVKQGLCLLKVQMAVFSNIIIGECCVYMRDFGL